MNYAILKTIIETSLTQYVCQNCHNKCDEGSIVINKIDNWAVDFHVICPHCKLEAQLHAEIGSAQINTAPHSAIEPLQNIGIMKNHNAIKESDIAHIEKNLTEKNSIEDLLK